MRFPLRFCVLLLPNKPWPDLLRDARRFEDLGFDALCLVEVLGEGDASHTR